MSHTGEAEWPEHYGLVEDERRVDLEWDLEWRPVRQLMLRKDMGPLGGVCYPLSLWTVVDEGIVGELGDESPYEKVGRHRAKRNLKSLYAAFVATDRDIRETECQASGGAPLHHSRQVELARALTRRCSPLGSRVTPAVERIRSSSRLVLTLPW